MPRRKLIFLNYSMAYCIFQYAIQNLIGSRIQNFLIKRRAMRKFNRSRQKNATTDNLVHNKIKMAVACALILYDAIHDFNNNILK